MKQFFRICLKCRKQKLSNQFPWHLDKEGRKAHYYRCFICSTLFDKKCAHCHKFRSKELFYNNKNTKDKLESWCKICRKRAGKITLNTYYERHKKERQLSQAKWIQRKRKSDPFFKAQLSLRVRLWHALKAKKWHKDSKFKEYLGCTRDFLGNYIESQFQQGMTWDNYGNKKGCWNIDHIFPLSKATNLDHMYNLCHYTNLRPLWTEDNVRKSNKIA